MKKLYLLFIAFTLPLICFTQEPSKDGSKKQSKGIYLDFNGGISIPFGVYTSYDTKKDKAGFASSGYYGQINLDWMGKNNVGLGLQYCFQHNSYKDTAKTIIPSGYNSELGSKGWSNHFLMAGPVYIMSIHRFSLDVRLLGGVVFSSSSLFNDKDPSTNELNRNIATGFAYEVGIGLGYEITPRIVVKANLSYIQGFPSVNKQFTYYISDTISGGAGYYSVINHDIKKSITSVNFGAGLVFKF